MKTVRIGVVGGNRGTSMINYCKIAESVQVVAICDKNEEVIARQKENLKDYPSVTFYNDFDEFLNHDMDAVVLANYANEHAPFAIKCLNKGLNVLSEVLPCQTMKEAVELIEAVEKSGKVYAYSENYCYMPGPHEMRERYRKGEIGEFEYGEGEYIHNCEPGWSTLTYGESTHWRNNVYSTFYCTHSLGPIIHITGLRPVSVVGFELNNYERHTRVGAKGGSVGIEMVTLENGAVVKSIHGGLYSVSVWFAVYGSKGSMETAREKAGCDNTKRLYLCSDEYSGQYSDHWIIPDNILVEPKGKMVKYFGHGGSDFYSMEEFVSAIRGDKNAEIIDVYEALDMFLPGIFAYRSILNGSKPCEIPNLRNKEEREKWRNDTACTDPKVAGDMLLPTRKTGTPDIPEEIYDNMKERCKVEMVEYAKVLNGLGSIPKEDMEKIKEEQEKPNN